MRILSHRGFWTKADERNSIPAFIRSCEHEFGLETDVRDCNGRLVISHDVPTGGEVGFDRILRLFHERDLPLAVNIKADGLALLLKRALSEYDVADWFAFDMSIPDMRSYLDHDLPVFARVSEVERTPPWIAEVAGIWFDSFTGHSYDTATIARYLREGKRVCIVSPELHRQPHLPVWRDIKALSGESALLLCTDYPEQARQFFIEEPVSRQP
jgi:glycerophosphoryl diester phosphodiesterase